MPRSAIGTGCVDIVLPLPDIAPAIVNRVNAQAA
jgi:chemotaxis response regulator CheB